MSSNYQQKKMMNALGAIDTKGKEGLRGMYHSPQDVSAFSDPFCGSVSVTPTRDEKQEPAKSGLEAKRDACAISAAHLDSPNTEIPDGKNMERE